MSSSVPSKCACGADARIRHRDPYVWVECKKKCGMTSGYFLEFLNDDTESERDAVKSWNALVMDRK